MNGSVGRDEFCAHVDVSRETMDRLDGFQALILKWNTTINLISPKSTSELWARHFLDSAQLMPLLPSNGSLWLDLGSGGGMPAVVCSILATEMAPHWHITCVESDQRKATFLRIVARELSLSMNVRAERIDSVEDNSADLITARALSSLSELISHADRLLRSDGSSLFLKGARHEEEVKTALVKWRFKLKTYPSITDPSAAVLSIGDISRV